MKIKIKNFGPIDSFEFDLDKDFYLIFGKNNTGKSYAITVVYILLKKILEQDISMFRIEIIASLNENGFLNNFTKKNTFDAKTNTESILKESFELLFIPEIQIPFENSFDSMKNVSNQINKKSVVFSIESKYIEIFIKINKDGFFYINKFSIKKDSISITIKEKNKNHISVNDDDDSNNIDVILFANKSEIKLYFISFLYWLIKEFYKEAKENIKNVYYLPSSRSGLYQALSSLSQIIAELSKNIRMKNKSISLTNMSEPLSDYFIELSNIKKVNINLNKSVHTISKKIEEKILNGTVDFDENLKKIFFKPKDINLKLDISNTSSMVSEISPIVAYLKYIINNKKKFTSPRELFRVERVNNKPYKKHDFSKAKPLIFIEEPEAHLHPEMQMLLMKYFIELTKHGVRFIITTHSSTIFHKFNNLILSKDVDINKAIALHFKGTKKGSVAVEMEMDELGVEDENFIHATEKIYNEKLAIIDKMNEG